jgi:hypothetical protein
VGSLGERTSPAQHMRVKARAKDFGRHESTIKHRLTQLLAMQDLTPSRTNQQSANRRRRGPEGTRTLAGGWRGCERGTPVMMQPVSGVAGGRTPPLIPCRRACWPPPVDPSRLPWCTDQHDTASCRRVPLALASSRSSGGCCRASIILRCIDLPLVVTADHQRNGLMGSAISDVSGGGRPWARDPAQSQATTYPAIRPWIPTLARAWPP